MTKNELKQRTDAVCDETRSALQTVYDSLNPGQKKQIVKVPEVKKLFDRYGVEYVTQ